MYEEKKIEVIPITHEDLMPSGKYKGIKMKEIPAKYYLDIISMASPRVKEYIMANLDEIKKQAELVKKK